MTVICTRPALGHEIHFTAVWVQVWRHLVAVACIQRSTIPCSADKVKEAKSSILECHLEAAMTQLVPEAMGIQEVQAWAAGLPTRLVASEAEISSRAAKRSRIMLAWVYEYHENGMYEEARRLHSVCLNICSSIALKPHL